MKHPKPTNLAKTLRKNQSESEEKLWTSLRANRFAGIKFTRQQPIGNYIVDFVCYDKKLIIEVDGGQHNEVPVSEKDGQRTEWLESQGFRVLRFWNNEVLENTEGVLEKIRESVN
jgi:very-short-patch-repair endonuclease